MSPSLLPTSPDAGFLGWPVCTDPARWDCDVALFGIRHSEPYARDPWPNDQARAPDALRRVSDRISYTPDRWDFDLGGTFAEQVPVRCLDCGDLAWPGGSFDDYSAAVTAFARQLISQGTQLLVVGGDHGVSIPVLAALEAVGRPVHIVHVDAHLDWRDEIGGVRRGYSSPLRRASELGHVAGMTQIGMRMTGSAGRDEVEAARRFGAHVFPAESLRTHGWAPVLATVPEGVPVYVTIDADGMDPTEMPAVLAPSPGGPLFREVAPFLRALAERNEVVGMDVVEIAPSMDLANGITCITAGRLLLTVLAASWGERGALRRRGARAR